MRCPQCGFTTFPHATTCKQCGRPLRGTGTGPRNAVPPAGEQVPSPPPPAPAPSWWGTRLPPEVAGQLDPETLGLEGLSLPQTILEARAGMEGPAAADAATGASSAPRYGGFWLRGMAALVDAVLVGGLALLAGVGAVVAAAGGGALAGGLDAATDLVAGTGALLAVAGVSLVYHAFFTGAWGQTPGKMLFGLTVARADGGPVAYGEATWRWAASWVALGLLGIGLLLIAVTPRKRGLHDLLAGTVVLRHPPASS